MGPIPQMMAKNPLVFSFNWTSWPFVELGDSSSPTLRKQLDHALVSDLEDWCDFMLQNFSETEGFSSGSADQIANDQYIRLARRLEDAGVRFERDIWWN